MKTIHQNLFTKEKQTRLLKNKIVKTLKITGVILGVLIIAGWLWEENLFGFSGNKNQKIIVTIEKGQSLQEISANLQKAGVIDSPFLLNMLATIKGLQKNLKAGRYEFSTSEGISKILNKLARGEGLIKNITIIEGWNLKNIAWYLEGEGLFSAEEFLEVTGFPGVDFNENPELKPRIDFSKEFSFLKQKPENVSLEGYLFPDTYQVLPGDKIDDVVRRMLKNFQKKVLSHSNWLEKMRQEGLSLHQVLTMASILEKEIPHYPDKQIAAGILWKRLRMGWPLQVDATVGYITGKVSSELTRKDLSLPSPFNTYYRRGLPLGPICNPGLDSIKAAIFYKPSAYWFYLNTPDGKTIFSHNYYEHLTNKRKYLK